ncbi:MAG: hypothetical protein KF894_12090 [Labilithrix sp.]|nr:hypothetical protein [Labilithrix sp.]
MPLAASIVSLIQAVNSAEDAATKRYCRRVLHLVVRETRTPVYVSNRAQRLATKMGLGDLRNYGWYQQRTKMQDPERKLFAWEHVVTVKDLTEQLLALKDPTPHRARRILRQARVAWILRSENERLNELGFRQSRPRDAYERANIKLL